MCCLIKTIKIAKNKTYYTREIKIPLGIEKIANIA
tara:strand:- start:284 stop:388 length:105 start_codon:yes stop_codon:yes gene_type:complete